MTSFGPTGVAVTLHVGHMIVNQASFKSMPVQYPDGRGDIHVSLSQKALLEAVSRADDVTEVDVSDLTPRGVGLKRVQGVRVATDFRPAPETEQQAPRRTPLRKATGAFVPLKAAHDPRNPANGETGRIIRVQGETHTGVSSYRQDLAGKTVKSCPEFIGGILAFMTARPDGVGDIKGSERGTTATRNVAGAIQLVRAPVVAKDRHTRFSDGTDRMPVGLQGTVSVSGSKPEWVQESRRRILQRFEAQSKPLDSVAKPGDVVGIPPVSTRPHRRSGHDHA